MTTKKHNRLKSLLSLALVLCMLFSACPLASFVGSIAAAADDPTPRRIDDAKPAFSRTYWKFFSDGELWFTTDIQAIEDGVTSTWTDPNGTNYADQITTITISNGVTKIGARAFTGLKTAVLGIPKQVKQIDSDAFVNSPIKEIYFEGSQTEWKAAFKATVNGLVVHFGHKHVGNVTKHAVASTCTKEGYKGDLYCSLCGSFSKRGEADPKAPHEWSKSDYAYIKEPTCSQPGTEAKFCVNCGTFNYDTLRVIEATGEHNWVVWPDDKLDDCAAHDGEHIVMHCDDCKVSSEDKQFKQMTYKCKVSADSDNIVDTYQEDFDALSAAQQALVVNAKEVERNQALRTLTTVNKNHIGHFDYDTTDPTCTEDGRTIITCKWCERYYDEQILPTKGHSNSALGEELSYIVPATCTEAGERGTRCTVCGEILTSEVVPDNHTQGNRSGTWVTIEKPDCVNKGYQWLKCNYCGEFITYDPGEAYDENGNSLEGKNVQKYIAPTPDVHTASRWFTTLQPTCTEKGEQIKICTVEGCPYFSDTDIGKTVIKISDSKALDKLIEVTRDLDKTHYHYAPTPVTGDVGEGEDPNSEKNIIYPVPFDERVYDVADELNMAILAAFQNGTFDDKGNLIDKDYEALADALYTIFVTAVDHHGFTGLDKDGLEQFFYDKFNNQTKDAFIQGYNCVGEAVNDERYVFEEIVQVAVELLIAQDSVINTTEDVVAILVEAWESIGDAEINDVVASHKDQIAKVTNKALAKQEIRANGHNYVRCYDVTPEDGLTFGYIVVNNEFVPVCREDATVDKWYRVTGYNGVEEDEDGNVIYIPYSSSDKDGNWLDRDGAVVLDADGNPIPAYVGDKAVTEVNCIRGDGNMIYQCTVCMELAEPTLVKQGSHSLQTTHYPPTCYDIGYDEQACTKCDYRVRVQTDIQLTHNYVETTIKESTCSKAGIKVKICTHCGDVKKSTYQTLALLPHTDTPVSEPATCTENGREGMICSVCGRFDGAILTALGHDYKETVIPPTCTELGYTIATCTRCGDQKAPYDYVAVAGHQYNRPINVAAACEHGSYTYEQCKICGYKKIYNERDNALGHQMVTLPEKAATCTEFGYTERIYCSREDCGYVLKESEAIPPTGHTKATRPYRAPTCTENGYYAYEYCAVCGDALSEINEIPATGHNWKTYSTVYPTCTDKGMTGYTVCTNPNCGAYQSDPPKTLDPTGHDFGNYEITEEATPFKAGTMTSKCKNCGEKQTKSYKLTFLQSVGWIFKKIFAFPVEIIKSIYDMIANGC